VFFPCQEVIVQKLRIAFLISAAAVAAASLIGPAAAKTVARKSDDKHVIVFRLPDGSIERIRYAGNRAPQVRIVGLPASTPGFVDPFWPASPFSNLDSISAAMDRETEVMLQQVDSMMQASPGGPIADPNGLPSGVQGYSVVSTLSGSGVCTRSVRYIGTGDGKPRIESSVSGNCAPGETTVAPVETKAPLQTKASVHPAFRPKPSGIIQVNAEPPAQSAGSSPANLRLASTAN
jgi:hypothetical protein